MGFKDRTYLCFTLLLLLSVIVISSGQSYFNLHSAVENPENANIIPIVWCTFNKNEQRKCENFAMAVERDKLRVGYKYFRLECKQAFNKAECMALLDQEKVTLTTLDAGEVFVGGRYHSLVPIMQEVSAGGFKYHYAVAVVKRNSLGDVTSMGGLRGKKACFAGVGTLAGWIIPVFTLMKEGGMEIIDCNNHVKSTTEFFGPSCAVNSLSDKYNPIGDNSDKLCHLCVGKVPGGKCTDADPYAGYEGAFRCLLESGDIAFLKHTTVEELTTGSEFVALSKDSFELLCKDGSRRPVDDFRACYWGIVPSDAVVTTSAFTVEERKMFQKFLEKAAELYSKGNDTYERDRDGNRYGGRNQNDQFGNRNRNDQFGNRNRFKRQNFGDIGAQNRPYDRNDPNNQFGRNDPNNQFGRNDPNNQFGRNDPNNQFGRNDPNNQFGRNDPNNPLDRPDPNNPFGRTDQNNPLGRTDQNNPLGRTDQNNPLGRTDQNNPFGTTDQNNPFGRTDQNSQFGRNDPNQFGRTDQFGRNNQTDQFGRIDQNRQFGQINDQNRNNDPFNRDRDRDRDRNRDRDPFSRDPFSRDPFTINRDQYGVNIDPYRTDANNYNRDQGAIFSDKRGNNSFDIQSTFNDTNGTYYEVFNLFESSPKYGIHGNLLFQDTTRSFMSLPEHQQTYSGYLGDALNLIMGVRDCPVQSMTMCVTSDPELIKCIKMSTALKAQLLKPIMRCEKMNSQIHCMQAIHGHTADVAVFDASDVYTAGLYHELVPFISEVYNLGEPEYYVVAVAKEADPSTELTYLRGKYTCHGGINTAAGWVYPMAYLISNAWIRPYGCNSIRAAAEYFTKSCVPGALSTEYNTGVPYDNLCDLCHGTSSKYCRRDASEDYYGHTGAFRCLVEGGGHVAFVKHTTVMESTGLKRREWWARDALTDDFELLCPDGTRAEVPEYEKCNLGKVKANAVVTRGGYDYNETQINAYINLFLYSQTFYGRKTADEFSFSMFTSPPPFTDLIFQDATQQLHIIKPSERYYSTYLGPTYMRARRIVDCHAGAVMLQSPLLTLLISTLLVVVVIRN